MRREGKRSGNNTTKDKKQAPVTPTNLRLENPRQVVEVRGDVRVLRAVHLAGDVQGPAHVHVRRVSSFMRHASSFQHFSSAQICFYSGNKRMRPPLE